MTNDKRSVIVWIVSLIAGTGAGCIITDPDRGFGLSVLVLTAFGNRSPAIASPLTPTVSHSYFSGTTGWKCCFGKPGSARISETCTALLLRVGSAMGCHRRCSERCNSMDGIER